MGYMDLKKFSQNEKFFRILNSPIGFSIIVFVLAFLVRVYIAFTNTETIFYGDSYSYLRLGSRILAGEGYTDSITGRPYAYWPPGWPIVISIIFSVFGEKVFWVRCYQIVVSSLTCVSVGLLARKNYGPAAGCLAAILSIVYAALLNPQIGFLNFLNDPTYHFLLVTGVLLYFYARERPYLYFFTGIILGYNALVKPDGLLVPLILCAALLVRGGLGRDLFTSGALLILGACLAIGPWTIRNYITFNKLVLVSTNSGVNLYVGNSTTFKNKLREGDSFYTSIRQQGNGVEQNEILNKYGYMYFLKNLKDNKPLFLRKLKYHYDIFIAHKKNHNGILKTVSKYNWLYVAYMPFFLIGTIRYFKDEFTLITAMLVMANLLIAFVYLGGVRYRLSIEFFMFSIATKLIIDTFSQQNGCQKLILVWFVINACTGIFFSVEFPNFLMDLVPGSDPY